MFATVYNLNLLQMRSTARVATRYAYRQKKYISKHLQYKVIDYMKTLG